MYLCSVYVVIFFLQKNCIINEIQVHVIVTLRTLCQLLLPVFLKVFMDVGDR